MSPRGRAVPQTAILLAVERLTANDQPVPITRPHLEHLAPKEEDWSCFLI